MSSRTYCLQKSMFEWWGTLWNIYTILQTALLVTYLQWTNLKGLFNVVLDSGVVMDTFWLLEFLHNNHIDCCMLLEVYLIFVMLLELPVFPHSSDFVSILMASHWLSFGVVICFAFVKSVILFINHELAGEEYTTEYRNIPVGIDILHRCCRLNVACVEL